LLSDVGEGERGRAKGRKGKVRKRRAMSPKGETESLLRNVVGEHFKGPNEDTCPALVGGKPTVREKNFFMPRCKQRLPEHGSRRKSLADVKGV